MTKHQKRRRLATWIATLLKWNQPVAKTVRPIRAEPLEKRELMAVDVFTALLGSSMQSQMPAELLAAPIVASSSGLEAEGESPLVGEGEAGQDLVAFAKALAATNTKFYGADWCPFCTQQKQLFQDGAKYLPFVEVTNADRTPNSVATANNITTYPTWIFPDGSRLEGVQTLATIAQKAGVAIPTSSTPYIAELSNVTLGTLAPLNLAIDGYSPSGSPLTISVTSSNPSVVAASVSDPTNRSLRITTEGYGEMVFELFEDKASRPADRVIELANQNFYDGLTFHRVVSNFVIQGGDPNGTGSGGSSLGDFDDQFNLDLLHTQSGVLSYAKSTDDTNDSQFFITDTATRFLDFNHSVFGQLVEGDSVREGIQRVAVNSSDKPIFDVVMSDVSVFQDTENGIVLLKPGTTTGTSTITVTVTDGDGLTFSRTFTATVVADTANGAPFLNDIPTLQATAGTAMNYTLTSQDKESNTVTYAVTKVGNVDYTLSVNSQTGVVTLTPPVGFSGQLQFRASVQQTTTPTTSDPTDSQLVTVNVGAAAGLTLALQSSSDTGVSNSDGLTNATTLAFNVGGLTTGATVEILAGTTVVGTATAASSTAQVNVNASALTGNVQFSARQTFNSQTTTSSALTLNLDRTAPLQIPASAIPASAIVGTALSLNLDHPEEGGGLTYALENAPSGMSINSSTGAISWTPTVAQLGAQSFTLKLTDDAGNVTTQNLSINVIQNPKLKFKLQLVSLDGSPITSIQTGQQFKVKVLVADQRDSANADGVFSAFTDLLFDSSIIRPIDTNPISHISPYTASKSGTVDDGIVNELGGIAGLETLGSDERVLAEVTFLAVAAGNASLRLDPADEPANETALYGDSGALDTSLIDYGTASIAVGANYTVANDVFNFDEDAAQQTLNVLANDTVGSGVVLTIAQVSSTSKGGTVSISSDGKSLLYKPAANVNGAETFTYTAANAQGVQQTATVTIQLTDVNDPPIANNDSFTISENSTVNTLDVLANDSKGVDQTATETLTVTQVSAGSAGGIVELGTSGLTVRYTPRSGFTGTETFTYTLSDGRGGTSVGTVTVLVNPAVPPPTAVNDSFNVTEDAAQASFDVLANDTPANSGDTLKVESVGRSTNGSTVSVNSDGSAILYQPAANFAGSETITYVLLASDGGRASGTVTFTVANVNDAPTAVADTFNIVSTTGATTLNVLSNDTDPDTGDVLTITTITQPPTGSGTLTIASDSKSISYTPPSSTFEGSFPFTYTIKDAAGLTSTATATVNVAKYVPRKILGHVLYAQSAKLGQINLTLTGTTASGLSVSKSATTAADGSFSFADLAPGNYQLSRPAMPFLNDQGQTISIVSAETDGDFTADLSVSGSLLSKYIDIRDFLGTSFKKSLTAVVNSSGTTQWIAPTGDWASLTSLSFQINTANVVVNAANSTASNLTATVPFTNGRLGRATSGDQQLIRLRGATTAFSLAAPTTSSSTASGEGEAAQSNVTNQLVAEGEAGSAAPLIDNLIDQPTTEGVSSGNSFGLLNNHQFLMSMLGSNRQANAAGANATVSSQAEQVDAAMEDMLPSLQRSVSGSLLNLIASDRSQG